MAEDSTERHVFHGVSYEAAVIMQDAVESGSPYHFKGSDGERFMARLRAVKPLGQGVVEIRFERIPGEWVT